MRRKTGTPSVSAQVNDHRYSRRAEAALILAPDALAGALVGAAVELAGFRAEFPGASESLKTAVRRVRPSHVLVSCDDPHARDEAELGPTIMTGARLFFFGTTKSTEPVRAIAERFGARVLVLPRDTAELQELLNCRPSPTRERRVSD